LARGDSAMVRRQAMRGRDMRPVGGELHHGCEAAVGNQSRRCIQVRETEAGGTLKNNRSRQRYGTKSNQDTNGQKIGWILAYGNEMVDWRWHDELLTSARGFAGCPDRRNYQGLRVLPRPHATAAGSSLFRQFGTWKKRIEVTRRADR